MKMLREYVDVPGEEELHPSQMKTVGEILDLIQRIQDETDKTDMMIRAKNVGMEFIKIAMGEVPLVGGALGAADGLFAMYEAGKNEEHTWAEIEEYPILARMKMHPSLAKHLDPATLKAVDKAYRDYLVTLGRDTLVTSIQDIDVFTRDWIKSDTEGKLNVELLREYVIRELCGSPNPDIDDALATAQLAHLGQTRRSGEEYIEHPKEVAEIVYSYYQDPLLCAAALMHDVLEDAVDQGNMRNLEDAATMISASIGDEQDGREVLRIVRRLSHEKGASYTAYVLTLLNDPKSLRVKLADMLHNLQSQPTPRQRKKYADALHALQNASQGIPRGINHAHWKDLLDATQSFDINEKYLRVFIRDLLIEYTF